MKRKDPWSKREAWLSEDEELPPGLRSLTINGIVEFVSGGVLRYGKRTHDSTAAGFWLGVDQADKKAKLHFGNATHYLYFTGSYLRIKVLNLTIDENGVRLTTGNDATNRYRITNDDDTVNLLEIQAEVDAGNETQARVTTRGEDATTPEGLIRLSARTYDDTAAAGLAEIYIQIDTATGQLLTNATMLSLPDGYLQLKERASDPAAPATNTARLYLRDNGSGKTQLCIRFNTGAVQVLATQP